MVEEERQDSEHDNGTYQLHQAQQEKDELGKARGLFRALEHDAMKSSVAGSLRAGWRGRSLVGGWRVVPLDENSEAEGQAELVLQGRKESFERRMEMG